MIKLNTRTEIMAFMIKVILLLTESNLSSMYFWVYNKGINVIK